MSALLAIALLVSGLLSTTQPLLLSRANCTPLAVVGGAGTSVTKTVTPGGAGPFFRDNWDTDFAVPTDATFRRYVATIRSLSASTTYQASLNLKYSNGTADQTFKGSFALPRNGSQELVGQPRRDSQPFQVNVNLGGLKAVGSTYTLTVAGCY
ncbi:hypothetical protein [Synechococcus elongatus]|uniref:hypothetical protein n=1 Tax=Synechococcus elongatus TaxID=32046 RepID=UPI000F7DCA5A|nr:hypothetical protein [Synechococcus elongatus]